MRTSHPGVILRSFSAITSFSLVYGGRSLGSLTLGSRCPQAYSEDQIKLLEETLGETLFLNAKLPTGKEFMPREISLLMGEEGKEASGGGT